MSASERESGPDAANEKPAPSEALFGLAVLLFGFSFRGVLIVSLWTWGWDLFLRPLLEIDEFMPEAVHRAGDVLSRVGAAAHLARAAWRQWGPVVSEWFSNMPSEDFDAPGGREATEGALR